MAKTAEELAEIYIKLRDRKAALKSEADEQIAQVTDVMEMVEREMMNILNAGGIESIKTKSGTFYKKTSTKVAVDEWESFYAFVQDNGLEHMLTKSAAKVAVDQYIEETGKVPNGLKISQFVSVGVRR